MSEDVTKWLEALGLGQYAEAFQENEVEFEHLLQLDHEILKEIGVHAVGHRLTILSAVTAHESEFQISQPASGQNPASAEPQHRQLTVMFADLVGSTELSQQMDVEDYRTLLGEFQQAATGAVATYDGFVARHQGDGLLAYFGYPNATETDAERAVMAGLETVEKIRSLGERHEKAMTVRVGIATGPVIVGDALSTDASDQPELAAFGQTPNLAARLQTLVQPNGVLVSATTQKLVARFFDTERVGPLTIKGFDKPLLAYQVLSRLDVRSPSEALRTSQLTPLIGRENEVSLIVGRSAQASEGAGQVVFVSAEPGVGKTRVAYEAGRQLQKQDFRSVSLFCSPYQVDTPLHPVTEALARELEFSREDRSTEKLVKIERWLNHLDLDKAANVSILASLLAVRAQGEYRPPRYSPEALREQHLRVLLNMVQAISQRQPLFVLAEDLHWADPTTLIFLERLIELIRDERVLLIITARPEFLPRWSTQPNVTVLALNHLSARESQIMVEQLFGEGESVSDDVLNQIVQRADGVPLFVEELSRTIAELPGEYQAGRRVPETLRDALTARLDRLPSSVRHIAQLAAVIGRQFPMEWLEAASNASPASLADSVQELVQSGLVLERHSPLGMSYEFKHALVRDSAYESLLRDERERLHTRIAQVIENFDCDEQPALIAFHYQAGGAPDRALPYWIRAGEMAQQRDANEEAAVHFRSALDYLERIGERSARTLRVVVGGALALHFSGSRETAAALLERHAPLAAKLNDPAPVAKYHITFGKVSSFHGQRDVARDNLERGLKLAESVNDIQMIAEAELDLAIEDIFKVRLISPRARVERVIALLEGTDYPSELLLAYNIAAYICAHSGHFNAGLALAKKAESLAHSLGHHGMVHPTEIFSWVYRLSGQWKTSIEKIEATLAENPAPFSEAMLHYYLSLTYLESGQVSTALPMLVESLAKAKRYRSKQVQVWVSASLAEALLKSGDIERAEEIANEAIAMTRDIQAATIQADRVAGLIARERGQLERAKELLGGVETHLSAEGFQPDLAKVLMELASVAHIENDQDRVADYLKGAHRLYVEMKLDKFASDVSRQAIQFGIDLAAN